MRSYHVNMAWFLVGGVFAIIGMGTYEQNRVEDRRRFDAEIADRRDARRVAGCAEIARQLAECEKNYKTACNEILKQHKNSC